MKVIVCQDQERLAWDSYVEFSVEASQYHRWAYGQAIEETFGHRAYRLAAADNGEIRGILPLVRMRSHVFGDALISMPFASHGGIVADTPDAREALVSAVIALALELRADRIELRQGAPCDLPWICTTAKVGMEVPLPGSAEELWNRLSSGTRNKIRSARKGGLRAEWGSVELLGIFYPIFAENMRNHGTPVYPRRWFEKLFLHGSGQTRILSVCAGGVPLGAGIATAYRRTLEWPWSAASKRTGHRNAGVFLYWSLLAWAIDHRFDCVDLGRCTRGGGTYEFKRQWGCSEKPLHWYHWLSNGTKLPELRPENPRFHWATQVWRHLPLAVANRLGPHVVRSIP